MTIKEFAKRCGVTVATAKQWIKKGYIPEANLEEDYVPNSAKSPYTVARAKIKFPRSIFHSIIKATLDGKHVLPSLYGMSEEEFDGYIEQLSEAGLIRIRVTDGITYYDPTLEAAQKSQEDFKKTIIMLVEALTKVGAGAL